MNQHSLLIFSIVCFSFVLSPVYSERFLHKESRVMTETEGDSIRFGATANNRQYYYPPTYLYVPIISTVAISTAIALALSLGIPSNEQPDVPDIQIQSNCPSLPIRFIETPDRFTPPDGCSNSTVLFNNDQRCYPLLQSCQNPSFWTTLSQSAFGVIDNLTQTFSCQYLLLQINFQGYLQTANVWKRKSIRPV